MGLVMQNDQGLSNKVEFLIQVLSKIIRHGCVLHLTYLSDPFTSSMHTGPFCNDEASVALVSPKFSSLYKYFIRNVKI